MSKFAGLAAGGQKTVFAALLESKKEPQEQSITESAFFESVNEEAVSDAIDKAANQSARADAMAVVLAYVDDGDDSAEALDAYAQALADSDEDGDIGEPEQEDYETNLTLMAEALVALGVPAAVAMDAMGGDDAAAAKAFTVASDFVEKSDASEDDLIAEFSVREAMMMEATMRVIRDGKVRMIRKPLKKKRLSSAQKAGLKKARMKAHSGAAKRARAKSMKLRKSRGM